MPYLIHLLDSPEVSEESAKRHYAVMECGGDESLAYATALAGSPAWYCGLPRKHPYVEIKPLTPLEFEATCSYGLPDSKDKQDGDCDFGFDFNTSTCKITHAISVVGGYAPGGGAAPDNGGAIGVRALGEPPEGCEIMVPAGGFSEKWYFAASRITTAYKRALSGAVGTQNSNWWRGYGLGEVLFQGVAGSCQKIGLWELTFKFLVQATKQNFWVGNVRIPEKRGWDYIEQVHWDTTRAGKWVKILRGVYVYQVYEYENFTTLGIG